MDKRTEAAIATMLNCFPKSSMTEFKALLATMIELGKALDDVAVFKAAVRYARGEVKGQNMKFPPTVPEFLSEARRIQGEALEALAYRKATQLSDWANPARTYEKKVLAFVKLRRGKDDTSVPVITRKEHPHFWNQWFAYYEFRRLHGSMELMWRKQEVDEHTVPCLSPTEFDPEFLLAGPAPKAPSERDGDPQPQPPGSRKGSPAFLKAWERHKAGDKDALMSRHAAVNQAPSSDDALWDRVNARFGPPKADPGAGENAEKNET